MPPPTDMDVDLRLAKFSVEHSSECILWMSPDGRLVYANESACRTLACPVSDLTSRSFFDIGSDLTPELWKELWKEIRSRDTFTFEFTLRALDGRIFPVEINVHRISLDTGEMACAFFHDIEERKRLQQLKDEFVSTVSHELRTPMTIIREGVAQVIEGLRGPLTPEQHRALSIALTGIDRLGRIINELLDVSKIEAGKLTLRREPVDMVGLVKEVCGTFVMVAKERHLEVRMEVPAAPMEVYADRDRIIQVLTNLIGNAIKFTEKGHVTVSLTTEDGDVRCMVADTGLGIPKADLGRVFNKFEQLGRVSVTGEKGTGLGLSICKGIIELHRGRIWAESAIDEGAKFTFTLPCETVRDAFKQHLGELARAAAGQRASLSAAIFEVQGTDGMSANETAIAPMVDALENIVRSQTGRKTDVISRDSRCVYLGTPSTVRREGLRLVERIQKAFAESLAREGMDRKLRMTYHITSFPEDASTEADYMRQVFGDA